MKRRENLKKERKEKGLTQQNVADQLGLSLRQYQRIELGQAYGTYEMWDKLEDLFNVHQRKLREVSTIHHDKEDNQ